MSASASSALASSLSRAPALSSRAAARGRVVGRAAAAAARRQRHRGRRPSSSSPRLVLRVVSYVQYTLATNMVEYGTCTASAAPRALDERGMPSTW